MFLFIDESEHSTKKVIGGILLPTNKVSLLEKDFVDLRIKKKLFGEVKWSKISGAYAGAYLAALDLFWQNKEATYHSVSYRRKDNKYKAAYMLIKAVSWKIENQYGLPNCEPLYVLFDNGGSFGVRSYLAIRQYLSNDRGFHLKLAFCNHASSHILGCLQISDLLTGAVASRINNVTLGAHTRSVIKEIEAKNGGSIGVAINRFPRLFEYKTHYFDLAKL